MRTRLATVLALALFAACATTSPLRKEAANALIPPDQEAQLGKQVEAQVLKQYHPLDDPQVQAYVQSVGQKIVQLDRSQLPQGIQPQFTVLDSPEVNAFAIPGGHIFVFSGLLKAADNEAELAGVLSHEMGHVIERHVAQAMVTQLGIETVASMIIGKDPSALEKVGLSLAENGYLLKYSRDQERQADEVGLQTMIHSSWDPHAMISFFQKLQSQGSGGGMPTFLQNHPPPADRVQYLTRDLQKAGNPTGQLNAAQYAAIKSQVPTSTASQPGTPRG